MRRDIQPPRNRLPQASRSTASETTIAYIGGAPPKALTVCRAPYGGFRASGCLFEYHGFFRIEGLPCQVPFAATASALCSGAERTLSVYQCSLPLASWYLRSTGSRSFSSHQVTKGRHAALYGCAGLRMS